MSSISEAVEGRILHYLRQQQVREGSRILLGLSGGPDSTALLHALHRLSSRFPLTLVGACLDHGLRPAPETRGDADFVVSVCRSLGLPCIVRHLAPGALERRARRDGASLEEAARRARYRFFYNIARQKHCDHVALGHTADDHLETIIMRFFLGAGVAGLAGIPRSRGLILRPLIDCAREEILEYLAELGRSFRVDSTNLEPAYLRNAVRLQLLPVVRTLFPGYRRSLKALAGQLALVHGFLQEEAVARLPWEAVPGGFRLEAEAFLRSPGLLRVVSFYALWDRLVRGRAREGRRLPFRFVSQLLDDGRMRRRRVPLRGHGVRLVRRGAFFFAGRDIVGRDKKGYLVQVQDGRVYRVGDRRLLVHLSLGGRDGPASISPPVVMRSRNPGDSIAFEWGSKSIKKLFQEWNVPPEQRWRIPVVADRQGVLAVFGGPFGYRNCTRAGVNSHQIEGSAVTNRVEE